MNRDETARLLRTRSALTSQPYGDEAIDAWQDVLQHRSFAECRTALVDASKTDKRITVAHLIDRLPVSERGRDVPPPEQCVLCDGCGWVSAPRWQAHNPRTCHPTDAHPCICHAAEPCRCSTGRRMVDVQRRIRQYNDEHRPTWAQHEPDPVAADPRRLDLDGAQESLL